MTHPDDRVYRFTTLAHWAQGTSSGLVAAGLGQEGILHTQGRLVAGPVARVSRDTAIVALTADLIGRPLWLTQTGLLWMMAEPGPVQLARLPGGLAMAATRLLWGQDVGWLVAAGDLIRLDVHSGDRMGSFARPGWRIVDAVPDTCDGVIVVETRPHSEGAETRLRQIAPGGQARALMTLGEIGTVVAAARFDPHSPVYVVANGGGWQLIEIMGTERTATHHFPGGPVAASPPQVTMSAPRQVALLAGDAQVMRVADGLLEPAQDIDGLSATTQLSSLVAASGTLYAASGRRVYALVPDDADIPARKAIYLAPVLRSPPGDRSGWLHAELRAEVPEGARVILSHRAFDTAQLAQAYGDALHGAPDNDQLRQGWVEAEASTHFGTGHNAPLRHYLGHVAQEYLALRIEISVPTGAPPLRLSALSVIYPNRSLIDEMPAIYRDGGASERQMRRMLAPFQALADEIDDLIGDSVKRVDPATADDLWAGFLLHWLGHADFAGLDPARRRGLLRALPEILGLRGTRAGLARVLDVLAPQGYSIEDDGLAADFWVLPAAQDPAGARLGRETRAAPHAPAPLSLGACPPLGGAPLGHGCFDPGSLSRRCHGRVTVRLFGGDATKRALAPFTDRIIRAFVPAHTHVRFEFGATPPPDALGRARGRGPDADTATLFTLDTHQGRALNDWRLPNAGQTVRDDPATLNSAVLDGALILH